jgi:pimeloyl-ACP methyl ester carboxylesterase
VTVLFIGQGCGPQHPTEIQLDQGLIWMFPGVEGGPASMTFACNGLRDGGVTAGINVYDWERPFGLVANLTSYHGNRAKAAQVAAEIAAFAHRRPEVPVDLLGYSGGGGLAIMVAEALPDGVHLRNIILGQPALSPEYDLTDALGHVDGVIVNFHAPSDVAILGWGTKLMGTMDRVHTASAGKDGFNEIAAVKSAALRDKLIQRPWSPKMIRAGHFGGHTDMFGYWWNRDYVAPYLRADFVGVDIPMPRSGKGQQASAAGADRNPATQSGGPTVVRESLPAAVNDSASNDARGLANYN